MLKNIRLHIEKDEKKQNELEQKLAAAILACQNKNINSFARNIPSLLPVVQHPIMQNHSLFCNKFGELNIVDYGLGRTLYGFHPETEITRQVDDFLQHAPLVDLLGQDQPQSLSKQATTLNLETSVGYLNHLSFQPCPPKIECLVVLGCGLGMHILQLLQNRHIENLIIYEPEIQYFQCSSLVNKWDAIFALAQQQKCQIFIQVEKDGRDIINDMLELSEHKHISHFYLYQHYNHPVFNSLYQELTTKPWSNIRENGISFASNENFNHYVPTWTSSIQAKALRSVSPSSPVLAKNLSALQKYFPNIYAEFKDYQPKIWLPVLNQQGEVNIVKADSLRPWYSDHPRQDCEFNYQNFNEQPNKDGLVLGYKGTKLAHYLHYQFVKQTEELLAKAEEEVGALPENVASIIMFGIGVGYQIETLLANHTVEKLFLCEPNTDFFYASLFAIDWLDIFETIDKSNARIYLNIGDDGSHLFRDLLGQFHSIGPYILNSTYFYQSYYNASLNSAIAQLREQLQVVISMGEYFDHAYYGIEHTKEGMRRNFPFLINNPSSKLTYDDKDVPVFIIGNGPSLDLSIDAIKEWYQHAIIISCGTALQALHRHGITPDFHAEIEQNRSTFDWPVLIGDLDYLKNITLISCNGIHPDTADLYKDVLLAFKEGESSTVSALSVLDKSQFEVLQHAFPTVSNFVCDLVSTLGFNHIYLMGVDLGFVDVKHHHSKSSGYYQKDGKETYDYSESNNTSLIVPGNFRPTVNTKHEFKVSRQIIEQVTHKKPKTQNFYNCSDGARINGTNPLKIEQLLIVSTEKQKQQSLRNLTHNTFSSEQSISFMERFNTKFLHGLLLREISALQHLLELPVNTNAEAHKIINRQKELLFASYQNGKSLLFYYLYGTVNYANAALIKCLQNGPMNEQVSEAFTQCLSLWQNSLSHIRQKLQIGLPDFDSSAQNRDRREANLLKHNTDKRSLLVITNSSSFACSIKAIVKIHFQWLEKVTVRQSIQGNEEEEYDHVIYFFADNLLGASDKQQLLVSGQAPCKAKHSSLFLTADKLDTVISWQLKLPGLAVMPFLLPEQLSDVSTEGNLFCAANEALNACLSEYQAPIVLPKYTVNSQRFNLTESHINQLTFADMYALDFFYHYALYPSKPLQGIESNRGTMGLEVFSNISPPSFIFKSLNDSEFNTWLQNQFGLNPYLFEDRVFAQDA